MVQEGNVSIEALAVAFGGEAAGPMADEGDRYWRWRSFGGRPGVIPGWKRSELCQCIGPHVSSNDRDKYSEDDILRANFSVMEALQATIVLLKYG